MIGSAPVCEAPRAKPMMLDSAKRHVDHAIGAVALDQAFAGLECGAIDAHVHAGKEGRRLVRQQIIEGHVDGVAVLDTLGLERLQPWRWPTRRDRRDASPRGPPAPASPPSSANSAASACTGHCCGGLRPADGQGARDRLADFASRRPLRCRRSMIRQGRKLRPGDVACGGGDRPSAIAPSIRPERRGPCRKRHDRTGAACRTPARRATTTLPWRRSLRRPSSRPSTDRCRRSCGRRCRSRRPGRRAAGSCIARSSAWKRHNDCFRSGTGPGPYGPRRY